MERAGTQPRLFGIALAVAAWTLIGQQSTAQLVPAQPAIVQPITTQSVTGRTVPSEVSEPEIGAKVSAIEIRLDAPLGRRMDLGALLAVQPGRRLTEHTVRRSLSSLQATGLFSEIEILTRHDSPAPDANGLQQPPTVTVIVVLRARTWVSSVQLRGNLRLEQRVLQRVIKQREASPLQQERVAESVTALQALYREKGFREAEVHARLRKDAAAKQVHVVFDLESGPRALVGPIRLEGEPGPFTSAEVLAATGLSLGSKYEGQKIEASVEKLRVWLARRSYLSAEIGMPKEAYDPAAHRMALTYSVDLGPRTEIEVTGATLSSLKRRGFLPFLEGATLDQLALDLQCQRIVDHLQRKGHFHATVTCRIEESAGEKPVHIEIEPGDVYRLDKLTFSGNTQLADDELRALIGTTPYRPLRPGSGRLVEQDLNEDVDNLRSYYLLNGFGDIEIETAIIEDGDLLALEIGIREGRRQRLVDFTFSGIELLDIDEVRADLPLRPGGPFHPVLVDESLDIIRALYEDQGFPSMTLTPHLDWNDQNTLVDVHVTVEEGAQAIVDRLIVRGQRRTRTEVIQQFINLEEGEPLSRRRLLEIERDLYRLGIFSKVDVTQRPVAESSEKRDVVVRLEEGQRYRVAYGLSYHSDDGPGSLLSVSRTNVGGRGDRVQLELRGNENDSIFRLLYDQPRLGRLKLPVTYSLFGQEELRQSFSVNNLGAQIAITKDLPSVRLRGVLEYRSVKITELTRAFNDLDPNDIERDDREVEIFSLIPILYVDRRDDPLDPQNGWSTALQLEYALPLGAAETNFFKFFWQQTHYRPLGLLGGLAASWRFGAIEPLGSARQLDPMLPADLPSALIPVSERFFAGGRTSHRAYDRDQLGIFGQSVFTEGGEIIEAGGNGLAVFNLDYRFPISGAVGGVFFFDYGNVWADWRDIQLSDFKPGAGLGIRYASPIGPIRLEIGWKLDPEPEDDPNPVFFLSFGNPF